MHLGPGEEGAIVGAMAAFTRKVGKNHPSAMPVQRAAVAMATREAGQEYAPCCCGAKQVPTPAGCAGTRSHRCASERVPRAVCRAAGSPGCDARPSRHWNSSMWRRARGGCLYLLVDAGFASGAGGAVRCARSTCRAGLRAVLQYCSETAVAQGAHFRLVPGALPGRRRRLLLGMPTACVAELALGEGCAGSAQPRWRRAGQRPVSASSWRRRPPGRWASRARPVPGQRLLAAAGVGKPRAAIRLPPSVRRRAPGGRSNSEACRF
jgi:hypothetical protein